jgi:peptidoglycan/LPS O-acetylase OafA/YrhL
LFQNLEWDGIVRHAMAAGPSTFRPDIEGLRGIAILLVVLFHAGVSALSGGFVGVDVFFVLSGFFITVMLTRELARDGSVNLTEFYGRRAVRLLPALLVVLVATLGAVMLLYAPIDRAAIAATARPVALYSGNVEFARNSVDYFGSAENPFLHTWSLGVEEQFYLVWPLLFLVVAGLYAGKIGEDATNAEEAARKRLLIPIALAACASFVASLWLTGANQPWAFFGMPTRIWEFAVGASLALFIKPISIESAFGVPLQFAGLVTIAVAVLVYDRATPYPGLAALAPVLATVALVVGGHIAPSSALSRVLSNPVLRWFGQLSYAWYLWHWPLVGLGGALDPSIGVAGKLFWSTMALGLAWLTYRFVEQPARQRWSLKLPTGWLAPAALGASLATAGIAHGAMLAAERRAGQADQRAFAAAREDRVADACWATTVEQVKRLCEFGDKSSSTTLVLLGDSHAQHWIAALDRAGQEHGWKIVAMVKGGCPVADMPELMHARFKRYYHECTRYREAMIRRIIAMRPAAAILSSWDHYLPRDGETSGWQVTPAMWERGLRRTYSRLSSAGIKTIAIRGTPRTGFDVPACLSRRAAGLPFAKSCSYDRDQALMPAAIAAQNNAARGLSVRFVDMNDQICAARRCDVVRNGIVVFTDDNHLTATFSASISVMLGERLSSSLR